MTQLPDAEAYSPGVTLGAWPTSVIRSRSPRTFSRSTQKPLSALWNVTRSTRPESCSSKGSGSGRGLMPGPESMPRPHPALARGELTRALRLPAYPPRGAVRFFGAAWPLARTRPTHVRVTDARHFLDDKGAIAPLRGPAKAMADTHGGVIAYATDFDDTGVSLPGCFKCKKSTVEAAPRFQDDAIVWHCPRCQAEGRISNWQGTALGPQ